MLLKLEQIRSSSALCTPSQNVECQGLGNLYPWICKTCFTDGCHFVWASAHVEANDERGPWDGDGAAEGGIGGRCSVAVVEGGAAGDDRRR